MTANQAIAKLSGHIRFSVNGYVLHIMSEFDTFCAYIAGMSSVEDMIAATQYESDRLAPIVAHNRESAVAEHDMQIGILLSFLRGNGVRARHGARSIVQVAERLHSIGHISKERLDSIRVSIGSP